MIELNNPRIVKLIKDKDAFVTEGRNITRDMEKLDVKIRTYEAREKILTARVKAPQDLVDKGEKLTEIVNSSMKELEALGKQIEEIKLAAIPADMKNEHLQLLKNKEKLERDRNKVALKIQKIKDKVVPIIQKEMKPLMETEFDDIETATVKGDKLVIKTFNHLEDFKSKFRKR